MKIKSVFLVIADISGYTSFIKLHRTSLIHAEIIITDLIESVISSADHPLTVAKLEGDAVFFYAEVGDNPQFAAQSVLNQLVAFFKVFYEREKAIVSCNACICDACQNAKDLRLKVIAHNGEALIKQIGDFQELAGEDVIIVHRLLKNSVQADEYLLMTDAFSQLIEQQLDWPYKSVTEAYENLGKIKANVFFPSGDASRSAAMDYHATFREKARQFIRFEVYLLGRLLRLIRPKHFSNLPE